MTDMTDPQAGFRSTCKSVRLLPLLLVAASLVATASPVAAWELVFEQPVVDLGRAKTAGNIEHRFPFRVVGSQSAEITQVRPSCGCLRPTLAKTVYAPGESGVLVLGIHSASQTPGPHRFQLSLTVKDPQVRTVTLAAQLELVREIEIQPAALLIYPGDEGLKQSLVVADPRQRPLQIVELVSSSKRIVARPNKPAQVAGKTVHQIDVDIAGDFPFGKSEEKIVVRTNDPEYPSFEIPVTIVRRYRVQAFPDALNFTTQLVSTDVEQRQLRLRDLRGAPIRVAQVVCDRPEIRCNWSTAPTPTPKVEITLDRSSLTTSVETTLYIHVSEPIKAMLTVPVKID